MTDALRSPRNGEAAQSTSASSPKRRRVTVPWKSPGVRYVARTSKARWLVARMSAQAVMPRARGIPATRQRSTPR
jgi:hypothetical protein